MSKSKIAELETLHRSLRDKRQADRVKAVIALSKGWSAAQVADILLFDETTSRHYFEHYQQGDVHVCKTETLQTAYMLAKQNNGAPGIDGVTFEAVEYVGVEGFLKQIRQDRRYDGRCPKSRAKGHD